jgi:hypothetical protein
MFFFVSTDDGKDVLSGIYDNATIRDFLWKGAMMDWRTPVTPGTIRITNDNQLDANRQIQAFEFTGMTVDEIREALSEYCYPINSFNLDPWLYHPPSIWTRIMYWCNYTLLSYVCVKCNTLQYYVTIVVERLLKR